MNQSGVFAFVHGELASRVSGILSDAGIRDVTADVSVVDICQLAQDKNGQRIVIDERRYELPALYALVSRVNLGGADWGLVLSAAGAVARGLKDGPVIELGEYNWHGNQGGRTFIEPIVRASRTVNGPPSGPAASLEYRIEAGVNSGIGEEFKRVEKRDLRTERMDGKGN